MPDRRRWLTPLMGPAAIFCDCPDPLQSFRGCLSLRYQTASVERASSATSYRPSSRTARKPREIRGTIGSAAMRTILLTLYLANLCERKSGLAWANVGCIEQGAVLDTALLISVIYCLRWPRRFIATLHRGDCWCSMLLIRADHVD
jgi:hypothetical protein